MAEKLLRSLNKDLSALSLDEARRAVLEAQQVLNSLRDQQATAEKMVAEATHSVSRAKSKETPSTKGDEGKADQYSEKSFWETRYNNTNNNKGTPLYEWYLSFEEWKPHLWPHLLPCRVASDTRGGALLVSGCGNSSLCEDLAEAGCINVAGFDYSPAVIAAMQQRGHKVRYFDADARDMKSESADSYAAVVDKGTLESIASGGGNNSQPGSADSGAVDAAKYMLEMWRILKIGGCFLVLSTMPPDVFYALAVAPLTVESNGTGTGTGVRKVCCCCDWESTATKQSMKTTEGGDVFFFALTKLETPSASHRQHALAALASSATTTARSKDDIMAGIHALLEEAKQAKLDMDAASAKCAARTADTRAALSALDEAEEERKKMEKKLAGSEAALSSRLSSSTDEAGGEIAGDIPAALPTVRLTVLLEQSHYLAGEHVVVQYVLQGGSWDEDDAIHLVSVPNAEEAHQDQNIMYGEYDDNKYEQLEYTTRPTVAGQETQTAFLTGQIKIPLPSCCSIYRATYVRTFTSSTVSAVAEKATITRRIQTLAQTDPFMIPARMHRGHPDGIASTLPENNVNSFSKSRPILMFSDSDSDKEGPRQSGIKSLRRRGAGLLVSSLAAVVEDQRSIRTVSIAMLCSQEEEQQQQVPAVSSEIYDREHYLTRVMAWVFVQFPASDAREAAPFVCVVVEADVALPGPVPGTSLLQTRYGLARLPVTDGVEFDLSGAQVELEAAVRGRPHKITCRLPYKLSLISGGTLFRKCSSFLDKSPASTTAAISCGFCGNELVARDSIDNALQLPSGLFDNVMHEFICSEVTPAMNLCMADMSTPRSSIMVGPVQANANPLDIVAGSVTLACKAVPTILDLFSGYGGSLATTPLPPPPPPSPPLPGTLRQASPFAGCNLVDIDTCLVLCARCGSYIGDGQLAADCLCPTHQEQQQTPRESAAAAAKATEAAAKKTTPADSSFVLADLRDVRMARYCIEMSSPLPCSQAAAILDDTRSLSIEQGVARIISHLHGVFTVGSFLLFAPTCREVLLVRVLSRDYAVALPRPFHDGEVHEAIKVSFLRGSFSGMTLSGTEGRVALQQHELKAVSQVLQKRSVLFGPSIFKHHLLGVLLK